MISLKNRFAAACVLLILLSPGCSTLTTNSSSAPRMPRDEIVEAMDFTTIPELHFDGVPISTVVAWLNVRSQELIRDYPVKISLLLPPGRPEPRVTLHLQRPTFRDAVHRIGLTVGLGYRIEDTGVVICPPHVEYPR